MAVKFSSSAFSCLANSLSSPYGTKISTKIALSHRPYDRRRCDARQLQNCKVVQSCRLVYGPMKLQETYPKKADLVFCISEDLSEDIELEPDDSEQEIELFNSEYNSLSDISSIHYEGTDGKPGLVSFYNRPYKRDVEISKPDVQSWHSSLVWFVGPAVLVASFIFPSLYLRKIISMVFEDSLLTDFLILFFTEALFYCGVVVFLLIVDRLRRPVGSDSVTNDTKTQPPLLGQKISSVAALVLSLIIPMVTMGLVWPWTGPAASATLAPYLVGIVVQFAFEQYAKYQKSPSWPVIPVIFHVYRLHQLNRAAQLVTALSFTVRGAELTPHNMAINNSLGALLNVLQLLGVICIWSLSSFLMRFFPSTAVTAQ